MQQFAHFDMSADAACLAYLLADGKESLVVHSAVGMTWVTSGGATLAAETQGWDLLGASHAVDSAHKVWLLLVTVPSATHHLLLVEEQYITVMAATLAGAGVSGDYAVWGRLVDGRVESYQQGMA